MLRPTKNRKKDLWRKPDYDYMRLFHYARARRPGPVTRLHPKTLLPIETFTHPKATVRTPHLDLPGHLLRLEKTNYEPDHNGVESPSYAHMVAIPASRTATQLSRENQRIVAERLRLIQAGEEPQSACLRALTYRKLVEKPVIPSVQVASAALL